MDIIKQIQNKLVKYPDLSFEETSDEITIFPKDQYGFEITLWRDDNEIVVFFEGWHEHFKSSDEDNALDCFALGLSDHCRLKVSSRGGKDYRWTLETRDIENDKWIFGGTTVVLRLLKFWKKKQTRYLQNSVIKIDA